jgi:hypothetical protein
LWKVGSLHKAEAELRIDMSFGFAGKRMCQEMSGQAIEKRFPQNAV